MFNNKENLVKDRHEGIYNATQQKNKENITKKPRKPKVHITKALLDVTKYMRNLEEDVPENESESAEIPGLKTICDIDKSFYKVIDGRPIRQFIDVKVYLRNIRDINLSIANTGFLKDQIIQIDTKYANELKEYDTANKLLNKTNSHFFQFMTESYNTAVESQQRAEVMSEELASKMSQLNSLSLIHVKLNNKIGDLAAAFCSLFRYGYFLNQLSEVRWIAENDIKNSENFLTVFEEAESNPTQSFEIYKDYFVHASVSPKIYFKKPEQLIRIFDAIGKQCLNYMQIMSYTASIVKPVLKSRDQLEFKILTEINEVTDLIVFYEQQIQWMEEKEAKYKDKFDKLLFKQFYDLYASYDATKLFTCVQFIHYHLFQSPIDPRNIIVTMVTDIESLFANLSFGLECLDPKVVKKVQHEVFSSDIKIMKRAMKSQRTLKEYAILKKSFITSFEAPRYCKKKMST